MTVRRRCPGSPVVVAIAAMLFASPAPAQDPPRPNVVVIFCDDLGYGDLGCYGATDIPTPHLDRLAAEGVRFTDFYVPAPVCTPSRAGLLTGRHPLRVGLPGVLHPHDARGLPAAETTLAELLRAAGYATGCFGKWHLGHRPEFLAPRHGFDESLVIPYSHDMYRGAPWAKPAWTAAWPDFIPLLRGEEEVERLRGPEAFGGLTERFTAAACDFIARHAEKPFLLYVPQPMPHQEVAPPAAWRGRSGRGPYGDAVAELDAAVGKILATLADHALADRTLVVVTSDNGPAKVYQKDLGPGGSAGPLAGRKGTCLEGGVRVPCIMRWPGTIPPGRVCDEVATVMDLLPTCAALAGGRPPGAPLDGRDILALLERPDTATSPHDVLPYYNAARLEAIRAGRWKLWLEKRERPPEGDEVVKPCRLYDLAADVGEARDVAADHPDVVAALTAAAKAARISSATDHR
jgi:arylsulfatase A-like enzyme